MSMTAILNDPHNIEALRRVTHITRLSRRAQALLSGASGYAKPVYTRKYMTRPSTDIVAQKLERSPKAPAKSWSTVCISLYEADAQLITELVEKMKDAGITRANRSLLIRMAVRQVNIDELIRVAAAAK